jgi:hypothetical protein
MNDEVQDDVALPAPEPVFPRRRGRPRKIDIDLAEVQAQARQAGLLDENGEQESVNDAVVNEEEEKPERKRPPIFGALREDVTNRTTGIPPALSAEETGLTKLIDEWIDKLKSDPQSYVTAWRVSPTFIEGKPSSGFSGQWSIMAVRNADDLLSEIEQENGGYMYQLKFMGYHAQSGKVRPLKMFGQVPINAPPMLRGVSKDKIKGVGGVISPDAEVMKLNNEMLLKVIQDLRDGGPHGREFGEMLKVLKEANDSKTDILLKQIEAIQLAHGNPSAETVAKMQGDARRELDQARERWEQDKRHDRERWEEERKQLLREHKEQAEKLVEKLEASQEKLKEREDSFSERQKHRDELHQRDIESIRSQWQSDVKRLSDQNSDERRATERLKEMYDLAKKTELDKQEGIFREQIKGQENRIQMLEQRIHDIEKQKEELQRNLVEARTSKPDALKSVSDTIGSVVGIASQFGMRMPGVGNDEKGGGEMRTEIGQLAKDMKDAGVVDAAKGVFERVATAIGQRQTAPAAPVAAPMMPMSYMMPPGAFPIQVAPAFPQPYPMYPPAPTPAPAPVATPSAPAPAPAEPLKPEVVQPTQLTESEIGALGVAVKRLEEASESGRPAVEIAKEVVAEVPRLYLQDIVNAGVDAFQEIVRQVCAQRPNEPDSVLLTPRGEAWLRELFIELKQQIIQA